MKPKKRVEEAIRSKLRFTARSTLRDRLLTDVMNAQEESTQIRPVLCGPGIGRKIMKTRIARVTSVAALIAVAALSLMFWSRLGTPAYAIEQTVEALQNVQFLHILRRDEAGQINDERWIEIGQDGWQVRYRQQNPSSVIEKHPGAPSMVIEDGESTAVYRHEKKAVILYDRKDRQYQWVGELGKAFENLRQEGKILEENSEYQGRPAHKVWWPHLSAECYVDPETKLPMAIGETELSYEHPPAGTFEITIPDGFAVLDKRPGAVTEAAPDWLLAEESAGENRAKNFGEGTAALIRGDYAEAAKWLEQGLGADSWATFWLGSAYYGLGQYDQAAVYFGRMLTDFGGDKKPVPFCNYALGLAQARGGHLEAATVNFQACLPAMIQTLRIPSGGKMFEYADNPKIRCGQHKPSDEEMVVKMINRLRIITGQNFGYDPNATPEDHEAAIAAWEQWFKTDGRIQFTPDAERLPVNTPVVRVENQDGG
jgi:tetratricopeptide (TPR) repeat protein